LTNMRKRGLILIAATVSAWVVFAYFGSEFERENRVWNYEASLPPYLIGAGLAIFVMTFVALVLVLIDHISWRRRKDDGTDKTN
jgi:hypothetical protein